MAVDLAGAHQALAELRQRWRDWSRSLQTFLPPGSLDETALFGGNLISGMIRAEI